MHTTSGSDDANGRNGPVLSVDKLSASWPGQARAIQSVSFSVNHGERIGVIGPNGAGKSTLFKAIVGIIPHYDGEISIHGQDCQTSHTMVGYVPQAEEIDWTFPATVFDVVLMGRARHVGWLRWPGRADRKRAAAALEQVGMYHLRNRQIGQLSGGQRRRVFIARALAQETDVLMLDEPFNGIDVTAANEIMDTLDRLRDAGITVIVSTHDLGMASSAFDRLLVINREVIAYGGPQEVMRPDVLQRAYSGHISIIQDAESTLIITTDDHTGVSATR